MDSLNREFAYPFGNVVNAVQFNSIFTYYSLQVDLGGGTFKRKGRNNCIVLPLPIPKLWGKKCKMSGLIKLQLCKGGPGVGEIYTFFEKK